MKKLAILAVAILVVAVLVGGASADDYVQPQSVCATNFRDVAAINLTTWVPFVQGATVLFTNCIAMACAEDDEEQTVQGLGGVTIEFGLGDATTSIWYEASAIVETNGTWTGSGPLPEMTTIYWQLRLTDGEGNVYYYQQQMLKGVPAL